MAFTIKFHTLPDRISNDGEKVAVIDGGALKLTLQDRSIVYYGPTVWVQVVQTPLPAPGVAAPPSEEDLQKWEREAT